MALASVSQVGIAMAYGNPDTGPGCGLGKLAWADLSGKKTSLRKYSWRRRMEPSGVRPSGSARDHPAAPMTEKSWRTIKPSSSWQPRSRIEQGIWHAQGEHLAALAILLGVPIDHRQMFYALAQERYREIIGRGKTSPKRAHQGTG